MLRRWVRHLLGESAALVALLLFAFLPFQVGSDCAGERHSVETLFILLVLASFRREGIRSLRRSSPCSCRRFWAFRSTC
jgi:hypothetical protein